MRTRYLILALFLPVFTIKPYCSSFPKRSIYLELGGSGLIYTLNFDYRFKKQMSIRGGLSFLEIRTSTTSNGQTRTNRTPMSMNPLFLNYLIGPGNHLIEIGGGPVVLFGEQDSEGDCNPPILSGLNK